MPLAIRKPTSGDVATEDGPQLTESGLPLSPSDSSGCCLAIAVRPPRVGSYAFAMPLGVAAAVVLGFAVRAVQSLTEGIPALMTVVCSMRWCAICKRITTRCPHIRRTTVAAFRMLMRRSVSISRLSQ